MNKNKGGESCSEALRNLKDDGGENGAVSVEETKELLAARVCK